jgi:hypothetical protein
MTKMNVLMQCGHTAQGHDEKGNPVCVICAGLDERALIPAKVAPDLTDRYAECGYAQSDPQHHSPVPSAFTLAFFEYRGEGSRDAIERCKHCGYNEVAHAGLKVGAWVREPIKDHAFESHGAYPYDSYYDGCRGWD